MRGDQPVARPQTPRAVRADGGRFAWGNERAVAPMDRRARPRRSADAPRVARVILRYSEGSLSRIAPPYFISRKFVNVLGVVYIARELEDFDPLPPLAIRKCASSPKTSRRPAQNKVSLHSISLLYYYTFIENAWTLGRKRCNVVITQDIASPLCCVDVKEIAWTFPIFPNHSHASMHVQARPRAADVTTSNPDLALASCSASSRCHRPRRSPFLRAAGRAPCNDARGHRRCPSASHPGR